MSTEPSVDRTSISPFSVGIRGRCPACGKGRLFDGYISVPDACPECGQSYEGADSADGPAVVIMFVVGFLGLVGMLIVEFTFHPPLWVHVVIWVPTILILSLGLLRPLKGIFIALQYRYRGLGPERRQ